MSSQLMGAIEQALIQEQKKIYDAGFQKGVERGRFEESSDRCKAAQAKIEKGEDFEAEVWKIVCKNNSRNSYGLSKIGVALDFIQSSVTERQKYAQLVKQAATFVQEQERLNHVEHCAGRRGWHDLCCCDGRARMSDFFHLMGDLVSAVEEMAKTVTPAIKNATPINIGRSKLKMTHDCGPSGECASCRLTGGG